MHALAVHLLESFRALHCDGRHSDPRAAALADFSAEFDPALLRPRPRKSEPDR